MTAAEFVTRLAKPKRTTSGWSARCPAHDDRNPSLSVDEGGDGRILVRCHTGCSLEQIVAALGLETADLFPASGTNGRRPDIETSYDYVDELGDLLYQVVRRVPKDFRQRRPDGNGDWIWSVKGVRRVPYRLPLLLEKIAAEKLVFVVEGEKDADRLAELGIGATTNAGGAGKWTPDLSSHFRGAQVVILPDNDGPGHQHAQVVAGQLYGVATEVKVLELPGLPEKGDVSDWFKAGGTKEELSRLVEACEPWAPETAIALGASMDKWPEPKSPPSGPPPVEEFNPLLLPPKVRPWIEDIAERMQCPPDFSAVACMVALAAVVGRKIAIRPKRRDNWPVVPNLWGLIVGRPGILKSPAIREPIRPLERLEREAAGDFGAALREHTARKKVEALRERVEAERIKKRLKNLKDSADYEELVREFAEDEAEKPPTERRIIFNDSTVEKLGVTLSENPNGLLLFRDELIGFLKNLDREGRQSDRAFYLEAWNGLGSFRYDRIGRGTTHIPAAIVSILGAMTPGPLRGYLRAVRDGGSGDDGLLQRFQLAVWPDVSPEFRNVDRWPDSEARTAAFELFARLHHLAPEDVKAEREPHDEGDEGDGIPFIRFDAEAQEAFNDWRATLEPRVRAGSEEHPAIESHLAKYRSLAPSLALIGHLAEGGAGPVGAIAFERAAGWCEYLESHARRLYAIVTGHDTSPAQALASRIQRGHVGDGFTERVIYRNEWSGLNREEVGQAISVLEDLGWLRREQKDDTGGRPTTVYRINPAVEVNE